MTYYSPSTATFLTGSAWTNPTYAIDGNTGTAATRNLTGTNSVVNAEKWTGFASVALGSTIDIEFSLQGTSTEYYSALLDSYIMGVVWLDFSWDGTNWSNIFSESAPGDGSIGYYTFDYGGSGGTYTTCTVDSTGKNLSDLQIKCSLQAQRTSEPVRGPCSVSINELRVNVPGSSSNPDKKLLRLRP